MKQWKTPLLALVVFGVLLAWVLTGGPPSPADKPDEDEDPKTEITLIDLDGEAVIDEITVRWKDRDDVVIAGSGEEDDRQYEMLGPHRRPTDQDRAGLLFRSTADLRVKRMIAEDPDDLEDFGLTDPVGEIVISVADGDEFRLIIGGPSPVSRAANPDRYVQLAGDEAVYLIDGTRLEFLTAPAEKWNDLTVLRLDDVQHIAVQAGEDSWLHSRTEDLFQWRQTAPLDAPARSATARSVTLNFDRLRAEKFTHDDPDENDLAACGLDEPVLRVQFREEGGEVREILLGSFTDETETFLYAKVAGRPFIYAVEADVLTARGLGSAGEWVHEEPLGPISYRNVTSLRWTWQDADVHLVQEGDEWYLYPGDNGDGQLIDEEAAETAVRDILNLEADRVLMPAELESAAIPTGEEFVRAEMDDGLITLALAEDDGTLYGRVNGYEAVYVFPPEAEELLQGLNGLR